MGIADSRVPNGIGILPLQHEDYDKQGFSVDLRASIVALRITGRDDGDEGLGQWFYDTNTPGTLEGGNFWDVDRNRRNCPGWAFAWSSQLAGAGGSSSNNSVATPGTHTQRISRRGGAQVALPSGKFAIPDARYIPKPVLIPVNVGAAGADPNKGNKNAQPPPAPPGQNQNRLVLGIGGSATAQGFGGPGVGFGFGFPKFQGVRTNFGGSQFPSFSGVRTNFNQSGFFRFTPPPGFGGGKS